jgi:hypothetical protein
MTEITPYVQLAGFSVVLCGFGITIATIVFYGGKIVQRQENDSKRIDNHDETLYGENGLERLVYKHQYHIENMCKPQQKAGRNGH